MPRTRLHAVDHVRLETAELHVDALRAFYGELLGLPPIPEADLPAGAACGFGANRLQLRILIAPAAQPNPRRRRLTIQVESLDETAERLEQGDHPVARVRGLSLSERHLLVLDPAGNRVELRQFWPM